MWGMLTRGAQGKGSLSEEGITDKSTGPIFYPQVENFNRVGTTFSRFGTEKPQIISKFYFEL